MIDLNEIIEDNEGSEFEMFEMFEQEIKSLSQEQLEQLNVEESIYDDLDEAKRNHRDILEISAAEVRWPKYFAAYRKVMGQPSILDPDKDR